MDKLKSIYLEKNGKDYDVVAVDENGECLVIAIYPVQRWKFLQRYFVVEEVPEDREKEG